MKDNAIIIGGGPIHGDLLGQIAKGDSIVVSANHYGAEYDPDFICYMDDISQSHKGSWHHLLPVLEKLRAIRITIRDGQGDVIIPVSTVIEAWIFETGSLAIWWSLKTVPGLVKLFGFDARAHKPDSFRKPYLERWQRFTGALGKESSRIMGLPKECWK